MTTYYKTLKLNGEYIDIADIAAQAAFPNIPDDKENEGLILLPSNTTIEEIKENRSNLFFADNEKGRQRFENLIDQCELVDVEITEIPMSDYKRFDMKIEEDPKDGKAIDKLLDKLTTTKKQDGKKEVRIKDQNSKKTGTGNT